MPGIARLFLLWTGGRFPLIGGEVQDTTKGAASATMYGMKKSVPKGTSVSYRRRRKPVFESIEPRLLFSADLPIGVPPVTGQEPDPAPTPAQAASTHSSQSSASDVPAQQSTIHELIVIDTGVPDAAAFVRDIQAQIQAGRPAELLLVRAQDNAFELINDWLQSHDRVSAIHLIGHGDAARMQLGQSVLDQQAMRTEATLISGWADHLQEDADILLYGCDFAATSAGRTVMQAMAALTGADIAASWDATGALAGGGDWVLEETTGVIEAQLAPSLALQGSYAGILDLTPTGPAEQQVNTVTTNTQVATNGSAVAADSAGNYVVVWSDQRTGDLDVWAQRYNAAGVAQGSEFQINTTAAADQSEARVAMNGAGQFVVVWSSGGGQDGDLMGVFARVYDPSGNPLTAELQINDLTTGTQNTPAVGIDNAGNFVVAWSDLNLNDVYARRFDSAGNSLGGSFRVNSTTAQQQTDPVIAVAGSGAFVIGWSSANQDSGSSWGAYAQRYDASGVAQGSEFRVNTSVTDDQILESIGIADDGRFVVTWTSIHGGNFEVYLQRYGANGVAQESETRVNLPDTFWQYNSTIAMRGDGYFAVTWQGGSSAGDIRVQQFDPLGVKLGGQIEVTAGLAGNQSNASMVFRGSTLVVVWSGQGTTDASGVFARRYTADIHNTITVTTTADSDNADTSSIAALLANPGDDGRISLGEAITAANNTANGVSRDRIHFNISEPLINGVHLLQPTVNDRVINESVVIDGATDPDFLAGDGRPVIHIDGSASNMSVIDVRANNVTINSLILTGSVNYSGIAIYGSNAVITNNFIGLRRDSTVAGNREHGIYLDASAGGTTVSGNVISGNQANGIDVFSSNNVFSNNTIGLNYGGFAAAGNGNVGIWIKGGTNQLITGNIISGNPQDGIAITNGASNITIQNNRIGSAGSGTSVIANGQEGIDLNDAGTGILIGGAGVGQGNQIVGNAAFATGGVRIFNTDNVTLYGNWIGTDETGTLDLGNYVSGINVEGNSTNVQIGGTGAGQGNIIADTQGTGIIVRDSAQAAILGNIITRNAGLGIDINADGVTANDALDADAGANGQLNFVQLASASIDASTLSLDISQYMLSGNVYRFEVYASAAPDSSGHGEGARYVGAIEVTGAPTGTYSQVVSLSATISAGEWVSITTTRISAGVPVETSEFSNAVQVANVVSGFIFNDMDADATVDEVGEGRLAGVTVHAYLDDGDGVIDAGDTLAGSTTTDSNGRYRITTPSFGTYWIVADSLSISGMLNAGFTSTDIWLEQTYASAGAATFDGSSYSYSSASGYLLGGLRGNASDDTASLLTSEHVIRRVVSTIPVESADFGFSARAITTTRDGDDRVGEGRSVQGSLRQFIQNSNASSGTQQSEFRIAGSGPHLITLAAALPPITDQISLNATTQPGYSGTPLIIVDGNDLSSTIGLNLTASADNSVIRGLVLRNFTFDAIFIGSGSTGHLVSGNYIGSYDADGNTLGASFGNGGSGIEIQGSGNTIGGTTAQDRNLIGGNSEGVVITGANANNNQVIGNYIGLTASGNVAVANQGVGLGVYSGASNNAIGGVAANTGNVISGNLNAGIQIMGSGTNANNVYSNTIGLASDRATALGNNSFGVVISAGATNTRVGLGGALERNIISSNAQAGILVADTGTAGTIIENNTVGTDVSGLLARGNTGAGIAIESGASGVQVGGLTVAQSNLIAFNAKGVSVSDSASTSVILGNSIRDNLNQALDLGNDGLTLNDPAPDSDIGPNALQNYPVIQDVRTNGGQLSFSITLNAEANSTYRIEFFASRQAGPGGVAQAQEFVGAVSVSTNGSGVVSSSGSFVATVAQGDFISATASRQQSPGVFVNTSELSAAAVATSAAQGVITVNTVNDTMDGDITSISTLLANRGADGVISLREAITAANNTTNGSAGADLIGFDIGDPLVGGYHTISVTSQLPNITDRLIIDGGTDPDFVARPVIMLDGSAAGANVEGFEVNTGGSGSEIYSLRIDSFSEEGISLIGADQVVIGAIGRGNEFTRTDFGGITLNGAADGTKIQANAFGTTLDEQAGLENGDINIRLVDANGTLIGGVTPGQGNLIVSNASDDGIQITGSATGNAILGNRIYGNSRLGINLEGGSENAFGVTPNDSMDTDSGPNDLQNYPVLTSAVSSGGATTIVGQINSTPGATLRIEFFGSSSADPSGHGEGAMYLGFVNVVPDGSGTVPISATLSGVTIAPGTTVSATATRDLGGGVFGSTSEFSANILASSAAAGVSFTPIGGFETSEAGGSVQFSVVLNSAPTANVTLNLSLSDSTEATLSMNSITFDNGNWNNPRIITVTGLNDSFIDGTVGFTLITDALISTDLNYSGLDIADVSLTNTDNDTFNTLVVDTTSDTLDGDTSSIQALYDNLGADGRISLREAIIAANNTANGPGGEDRIHFAINDPLVAGAHTILINGSGLGALPWIESALIIDGSTEPDHRYGPDGSPRPVVELDGSNLPRVLDNHAIRIGGSGDGTTIRGLVINQAGDEGILIWDADNVTIVGNLIGTDVTGTLARPNAEDGIVIGGTATNIQIGGATAALRNLISGNTFVGVNLLTPGTSMVVQGNFIGTDITGASALGNGYYGIGVLNGQATVGGLTAGSGNVISGNILGGIRIAGGANHSITGNIIGLNALGNAAIANGGSGIQIDAGSMIEIGGTTSQHRNIFAGNTAWGITISNPASNAIDIEGNWFGQFADGSSSAQSNNGSGGIYARAGATNITIGRAFAGNTIVGTGPSTEGVRIDTGANNIRLYGNTIGVTTLGAPTGIGIGVVVENASSVIVGGVLAGSGNVIANSRQQGVVIRGTSSAVEVVGNSIYNNTGLGIDLGAPGPDPNDASDADTGANGLQNTVNVTSVRTNAGRLMVDASFLTAGGNFRIDFYASTSAHPSGFGEGQRHLGSENHTSGAGSVVVLSNIAAVVGVGEFVTAVITDAAGNSSEFSNAVAAQQGRAISGTIYHDVAGEGDINASGTLRFTNTPVALFRDDGDGLPDAGDTLAGYTFTDANGAYSFSAMVDGTVYWTVVNAASLVSPSLNAGFSSSDVWAEQTYASSGALVRGAGGPAFTLSDGVLLGGARAEVSDGAAFTLADAEHVIRVEVNGVDQSNVDFGFSFNAVTNSGDIDADLTSNRFAQGSLRQFINNSNALSGTQAAMFRIASTDSGFATGVATITLNSTLPQITDSIILNGATQTTGIGNTNSGVLGSLGAVGATGAGFSLAGVQRPEIEIRGVAGSSALLDLRGGASSYIANLALIGGGTAGDPSTATIRLDGTTGTVIENNFIGGTATSFTAPGGALAIQAVGIRSLDDVIIRSNLIGYTRGHAISLEAGASNSTIERNEIRAAAQGVSDSAGIAIRDSNGILVEGNLIADSGGNGIELYFDADFNVIRGNTLSVSGALGGETTLLDILGGSDNNQILANRLQFSAGQAIAVNSSNNNIIGTAAEGNEVIDNTAGILIQNGTTGTIIQGNAIGIDLLETAVRPNGSDGIRLSGGASSSLIGGTAPGQGNVIRSSAGSGISVTGASSTGNAILGNRVWDNGQLGIDLQSDGVVLANDLGDADVGANNRQNFPVISSATSNSGNVQITGALNGLSSRNYHIEFFADSAVDASGHGEARYYLGAVVVSSDATGLANFSNASFVLPLGVTHVSATATLLSAGGNPLDTSELALSTAITAAAGLDVSLITAATTNEAGASARFQVRLSAAPSADVTVNVSVSDASEGAASVASLTFTASNWNSAQFVDVTGVNDLFIDGNIVYSVTFTSTSSDAAFDGLSSTAINLTNTDDDTRNIIIVDTTADLIDGDATSIVSLMDNRGADGRISLREAITAANATANGVSGVDEIRFNLALSDPNHLYYRDNAATGFAAPVATVLADGAITDFDADYLAGTARSWWQINLATALPTISSGLLIDGTSQAGASAGLPVIFLDGSALTGAVSGLNVNGATGFGLYGLAFGGFVGNGSARAVSLIDTNTATLLGNYFGTDISGTVAIANAIGLSIEGGSSIDTTVGGAGPGQGNLISGNTVGIAIAEGSGVRISGNRIGTDASGSVGLGNASSGILVSGNASVQIGSVAPGGGNLISGNNVFGVEAYAGTLSVFGNLIGTNQSGDAAVGNTYGIYLAAGVNADSVIGGATGGNVISGNAGEGLYIEASGVEILGNKVGVGADGVTAVSNGGAGIFLSGANNLVGPGNIVSANVSHGIQIDGIGATGNRVVGSYIGVDVSGTAALGNQGAGIAILNGATANQIGEVGQGNVISGNGAQGILIDASNSNRVYGNLIGLSADGLSAIGNGQGGIRISGGSAFTVIGDDVSGGGNVISGNTAQAGISVRGGSNNTTIQNNIIGTLFGDRTAAMGNGGAGIEITGASSNNQIGGSSSLQANTIAFNGGVGIVVADPLSLGNRFSQNMIYGNTGLGIDLGPGGVTVNDPADADNGANNLQNFPVLLSAITNGAQLLVSGSLNSVASRSYRIEFYSSSSPDPTGYGEGERFLGFLDASTDGAGNIVFSNHALITSIAPGAYISATATRLDLTETSEFSQVILATAANDPPVITGSGAGRSYTENAVPVVLASDLLATDADDTDLTGATVTISGNYNSTQDRLRFADQLGITGIFNTTTGILTLTGTASVADYVTALRSVAYENISDVPSTAPRTVRFVVNDGLAASNTLNVNVTTLPVNDAPVIMPTSASGLEDSVTIVLLTATDIDGSIGSFRVLNLPALGALYTDSGLTQLLSAGQLIPADPGGQATLYYQPPADFNGIVTFDFVATDNLGQDSAPHLNTEIIVDPVNDSPIIAIAGGRTVDEDGSGLVNIISLSDIDSTSLTALLEVVQGSITADLSGGAVITAGANGSSSLTLSGTTAQLNAVLAALSYTPEPDFNGTAILDITVDDGQDSTFVPIPIVVNPINDAPTITAPAATTVTENVASAITVIAFGDVDAGSQMVRVQFSVDRGTLNATTSPGVSISGAGGFRQLEGSLADINALILAGRLTFTSAVNDLTPANLDIAIDDLGNSGAGGGLVATYTLMLNVSNTNQAPVLAVPASLTVNEENAATFSASVSDPDGLLQSVRLTASAGLITVNLSGGASISAGVNGTGMVQISGTLAQINSALTLISLQPPANFVGSLTVTYTATDPVGAVDVDVTTITVTAVNDAPQVIVVPTSYNATEQTNLALQATGISVSDPDAGAGLLVLSVTVTEGILTANSGSTGVAIVSGNGSGNLALRGTITQLNQLLAGTSGSSLVYFNGLNAPATTVNLSFSLNDQGNSGSGGALVGIDSAVINIAAVQDAPVITLPTNFTLLEDTAGSLAFTVSDADSPLLDLVLQVSHGTLDIGALGGVTVTAGSLGSSSVALRGSALQLNGALASLTYLGDAEFSGSDTLQVELDDGVLQVNATALIGVAAVNDAPELILPAAGWEADEDSIFALSGIAIADLDVGTSNVEVIFTSTSLRFFSLPFANVSASGGGTNTLVLNGSIANLNTLLSSGGLNAMGNPNFNGSAQVFIQVSDQGGTGAGGAGITVASVDVEIFPVNDAPVVSLPGAITIAEDTAFILNASLFPPSAILSDVDAANGQLFIELQVENGTVRLGGINGLNFEFGGADDSSYLSFRGTLTDIHAAMNGLRFTPDPDFFGTARVSFYVDDQGNTGAGDALNDFGTLVFNVSPVNDAPSELDFYQEAPVVEGAVAGTFVGSLEAFDIDDFEGLSFSLANSAGGRFAIDSQSGEIRVAGPGLQRFEEASSYRLAVRVSDPSGAVLERSIEVRVGQFIAPGGGSGGNPGGGSNNPGGNTGGTSGGTTGGTTTAGGNTNGETPGSNGNAALISTAQNTSGKTGTATKAGPNGVVVQVDSMQAGAPGAAPVNDRSEAKQAAFLELQVHQQGAERSQRVSTAELVIGALKDLRLADIIANPGERSTWVLPALRNVVIAPIELEQTTQAAELKVYRVVVESVQVGGVFLTVGVVLWVARAGTLVAAMLTSMPTWKAMDPLVLLQNDDEDSEDAWDSTQSTELGAEEAAISELLGGQTFIAGRT